MKNATSMEHSAAASSARVNVCVLNSLLTLGLSGAGLVERSVRRSIEVPLTHAPFSKSKFEF